MGLVQLFLFCFFPLSFSFCCGKKKFFKAFVLPQLSTIELFGATALQGTRLARNAVEIGQSGKMG